MSFLRQMAGFNEDIKFYVEMNRKASKDCLAFNVKIPIIHLPCKILHIPCGRWIG